MAISSDLEQIHEDIAATPDSSSVAELGEILENITTDPNLPRPTSFPARLFDAILEDGVTVSSHNTQRLILALGKVRQLHKSLNQDSIRLLVYILLTSDDKAEQERALHLLLENFRNNADAYEKLSKEELLLPCDKSLSIRYKLISILYTIFLGQDRNVNCRRMAGKLLVESIIESRDTEVPTFQLRDLSSYCPRTVSDARHETDVVLRFFAGFIIRTLYLSGIKEDVLWSSCDQHCRDTFVKCLQEFPDDWVRSFQLFVSEEEHLQPRNTRANARKSGRFGSTNVHSCHLARSITIGTQSFARHAILASITPTSLIFILPVREGDGGHFHYIEIPDQYISQCIQCNTTHLGEQKYTLRLTLATTGFLMMNGEEKPLNGSTVYIASNNDLWELYNALKESEKKPQKGRVIRRISSTIVALDNGEEVTRKSIKHLESSSGQQGCLLVNDSDAIDDNRWSGISGQPANEENTQSELAQVTPAMDESQLRASQEMYASGAALGEISLSVSPDKRATSGPSDGDMQPPEKVYPINGDTSLAEACLDKGDIPISKDLTSNAGSKANADNGTRPQTSNVPPITLQPRRSSRSSTCEQEAQNESSENRNRRGRVSSNRRDRSKLPNTQESLLFPLRRSTRKVYTSNPKAAVDWEEDLRPTEEDETERDVQKDLDVTSISSPSPGGKSIFNHKPNTAQKKRKARATPSSAKGKNQKKRNRASGNRGNKRATKLPLQPKESNGSNGKLDKINSPKTNDATKSIKAGIKSENRTDNRPDTMSEREYSPGLAPQFTTANNNSFPVRGQGPSSDKENRDPSTKSPHKQEKPGSVVIGGIGSEMKATLNLQGQGLREREQVSPDRNGLASQGRYSLPQNNDIPPLCDDDEQTSLSRCMGSLVTDKHPVHQTTLGQREDSQDLKDVAKGDERLRLLPASTEKYQRPDTSTQTARNEEHESGSKQSISEQCHQVSDNKKRSAAHDPSETQSKKLRMNISPNLEQATLHQARDLAVKNSENHGVSVSTEKPTAFRRSTIPSVGEEYFILTCTTPSPKSHDFGVERLHSPFDASNQAKLSLLSTSSSRKSIVDENGSPRLLSRHHENVDPAGKGIHFSRFEYVDEDTNSQSEYYGDHDDTDFTDCSMSNNSSISTLRGPHTVASTTKGPKAYSITALPTDTDEVEEVDPFNMGSRIPVTEKLRRCAKEPNQPVNTMITPYSILGSPRKEASPEVPDPLLQGSLSNDFSQPQPEVTEPRKLVEEGHSQPEWQRSLETMQKATQDMLLSTNQRLTDRLEGEKETISQVLDTYRQGCHQFLDQLFHAHEQRIELYRQQMASVRQQHEDICRDLIRRLEENDKRIQERLSTAL